jgi:hypothetical protein
MARSVSGRGHGYTSERLAPGPRPATFAASWNVGAWLPEPPGALDEFLAERYALYSVHGSRLVRVRVRHAPWRLREASVERCEETISRAAGVAVPDRPELARFSPGVDVEVLAPEIVR